MRLSYEALAKESMRSGRKLPENEDSVGVPGNRALRRLDRAVLDYLNKVQDREVGQEFQTIRALFPEGKPLYPGAGFRELTHVQLCVREPRQVLGVFRVPDWQRVRLGLPDLYGAA